MGKCDEILLELLKKLQQLCDKNKIDLFLFHETALSAYRDHKINDDIQTCVRAGDVQRLCKALKKNRAADFDFECMLNNDIFPAYEIRVFCPGTIDFNVKNYFKYKNNCLHIKIKIIVFVSEDQGRVDEIQEVYGQYKQQNEKYWTAQEPYDFNTRKSLFKKSEGEKIFNYLTEQYAQAAPAVKAGGKKFKAELWDKKKKVVCEDTCFYIPSGYNAFFTKLFGKDWEKHEIPPYKESETAFRDASHDWTAFAKRINGMDFRPYYEQEKLFKANNQKFKEINQEIQQYYYLLDRTDDRFTLKAYYDPIKEQVVKAHEAQDHEQLKTLLDRYLTALSSNYKHHLGLCFDVDILNITLDYLRWNGQEAYAKELYDLIPEQHKENLKIKNYKGEYIGEASWQ